MIVSKNLSYLKEFLGITDEEVVKAVVKGKLRTEKYEIKADYIEDGVSLLVTDLKGEEVFFRGLVVDFKDEIQKLLSVRYTGGNVDFGKLVVYHSKGKFIVKRRKYVEKSGVIVETPILETENLEEVVKFVKEVLGVK